MKVAALVLPFRVNEYVLTQLVDWSAVPQDPLFQLVFPQPGMLSDEDRLRLTALQADPSAVGAEVRRIRARSNPHPSGQRELNVPDTEGTRVAGVQHKYRETVLYFPGQGQTCHAYCLYCFRWAQFVGDADLRFAAPDPAQLVRYLGDRPEVTDVLFTGGDPMVMSADRLREHVRPVLGVPTVQTIRFGTKSPAFWPYRFLTDPDADDLLRLFEEIVGTGRQLAVMAHFSHPRELENDVVRAALARIRSTGAAVYGQAPMIAHVNDSATTWDRLLRRELALGVVPYYVFVERDTGPHEYFKVPLARATTIFSEMYRNLPGLARTVRGPVMSATPGKVVVDGVAGSGTDRHFQLRMLQARDPALAGRPFRARYSPTATWLSQLRLADDTPDDIAAALRPWTEDA